MVNLDGIKPGQIKLSGELLADLFSGVIPKWNDKRIADMNPGVALPDAAITVVHRADGSGTTAVFTDYLAKVNANWKSTVGAGAAVKWPAASSVGGKGNEGVAANVSRIKTQWVMLSMLMPRKTTCLTSTCAIWRGSLLPLMMRHLRLHLQVRIGQRFQV